MRQYLDYLPPARPARRQQWQTPVANDKRAFLADDVMAFGRRYRYRDNADTNERRKTRTAATMQLDLGERFTYNFTVSSAKPIARAENEARKLDGQVCGRTCGDKVCVFHRRNDVENADDMSTGTEFVFYPHLHTRSRRRGEYIDADPVTVRALAGDRLRSIGDTAQRQAQGTHNFQAVRTRP